MSQIGIPNPLFGVRIRANTLTIVAVNNKVENKFDGNNFIIKFDGPV